MRARPPGAVCDVIDPGEDGVLVRSAIWRQREAGVERAHVHLRRVVRVRVRVRSHVVHGVRGPLQLADHRPAAGVLHPARHAHPRRLLLRVLSSER